MVIIADERDHEGRHVERGDGRAVETPHERRDDQHGEDGGGEKGPAGHPGKRTAGLGHHDTPDGAFDRTEGRRGGDEHRALDRRERNDRTLLRSIPAMAERRSADGHHEERPHVGEHVDHVAGASVRRNGASAAT